MKYDAVLLIAFGGPEKSEDVRPFLANVLRGRRVSEERIEEVAKQYEQIGGRSPINELTFAQAQKLRENLKQKGIKIPVYVGMKNWAPYLADVLKQIAQDGHKNVLGIIMAAHVSEASWGRYQESLADIRAEMGESCPQLTYCQPWGDHPLFVSAIARRIQECQPGAGAEWIFTAHSIPNDLDTRSGYSKQIERTAELVCAKLGREKWHLAWQSRSGLPQDPWLEPDIVDKIAELKSKGASKVAVIPIGFICDHVEVLFDLDFKAAAAAKEMDVEFLRCKTVGDHSEFIQMLSEIVQYNVMDNLEDKAEKKLDDAVVQADVAALSSVVLDQALPVSAADLAKDQEVEKIKTEPKPKKNLQPRVVIVGGGVSGISAMLRLKELARSRNTPLDILMLESSGKLGGLIRSLERQGCLMELGPDAIFSGKLKDKSFFKKLGLEDQMIATNKRHRSSWVVNGNRLLRVPTGFYLMAPSKLFSFLFSSVLSWKGKFRVLYELFVPPLQIAEKNSDNYDETLASFVERRFGKEMLTRLAQPMIAGIYNADPAELSLRATFPQFLDWEQECGSVIKGLWKHQKKMRAESASGARYSLFFSFKNGMKTLVDAALKKLPIGSFHLGLKVQKIEMDESQDRRFKLYSDHFEIGADAICLALASCKSAELLKPLDKDLANLLETVRYSSTLVVNFVYHRKDIKHPLDGFGFVVPSTEKRVISGCTFSSTKFTMRSDKKYAVLRAFVGNKNVDNWIKNSDKAIEKAVRRDLRDLLGIEAEPCDVEITRHNQSMPSYRLRHLELVDKIERRVKKFKGLSLAGNAYRGVGIPDCIESGQKAAEKIFDDLFNK